MAQPPDPTRRLRALRRSVVARPGWVPPPAAPPPIRESHGAHRRGRRDAPRSGRTDPRTDVEDRDQDDPGSNDDDPLVGLGVEDLADGETPDDETSAAAPHRLSAGPWGRLAEKWVPESMRDARVDPGRRGAVVLSVVAAVAAVVAAVGVWRDRPEPRPVQAAALTARSTAPTSEGPTPGTAGADASAAIRVATQVPASGAAPPPTTPEAPSSAPPPAVLYVSVTGLVHKPGLVRLPPGSRVADAIEAAGGAAKAADLTGLNLAQPLTDGDSVVVGGTPAAPAAGTVAGPGRSKAAVPGVTAGPTGSPTLVDLNTADQPALESLPGVGPVMASNILAWRTEHGAFTSVEQLQEISGIGPARYAQLAPMVTVSG